MEIIKKIGIWLAMGLFIGAGFTVSMYIISYYAMDFYMDSMTSKSKEKIESTSKESSTSSVSSYMSSYKEFSSEAGIIITSHKERKVTNSVDILGVLENQGEDTWGSINIEVELFDKEGNFVDECSEYISGNILPGEKQNFKVSCRRCEKNPLPEYKKYTIKVKDAHYKRK